MKATREEVAGALISLGYEINRSWQFKLRDERTPSAKINMDGSVHDFGTGWHGDLIDVLKEYHSMSFKEAKAEAQRLLGMEVDIDFSTFEKSSKEKNNKPLPESFMVPHRLDAKTHRQAYLAELKRLFMGEYAGEKLSAAKWENILKVADEYDIGYNNKSGRLIMPIKNLQGQIVTFWKYKKEGKDFVKEDGKIIKHKKVLFTKGRERPPFALKDLQEYREELDSPVLITEGEKDALVALANGQRAICIGGAGASKKLKEEYLELFRGLSVIIAGDFDEAGEKFNENLKEQLEPIAKSVTILDWRKKAARDGFKLHKKFDLADYFAWKNNHKAKKRKKVVIQQIITKEIEVELEEGQDVTDVNLDTLFHSGETIHQKFTIKEVKDEAYNA